MKEDIYIRVDCFYYYALSNSLYLIFYLLPYDSQIKKSSISSMNYPQKTTFADLF